MDKMTNVKALGFVLDNCDLPDEVAEKVKAMKASFEKRNASKAGKPSKKATENAAIGERVIAAMAAGEYYDTNGIKALLGDSALTPQKVTAVMKTLGDRVVAEKVKGKAVYRLA
jgi:hypothetical protein